MPDHVHVFAGVGPTDAPAQGVQAACVESHRELYNAALQERRDAWSHSKTRIHYGTSPRS